MDAKQIEAALRKELRRWIMLLEEDLIVSSLARAVAGLVEGAVNEIAFRVEHPELAHLHYDGCPFKPWADKRDDDIPDPRPDCTCGGAAKGAYWKGQHLLERGYKTLVEQERDVLLERVKELKARVTTLTTLEQWLIKAFKKADDLDGITGWWCDYCGCEWGKCDSKGGCLCNLMALTPKEPER